MIINKSKITFLESFKDIIFNDSSYIGYKFQEENILIFVACKNKKHEFFKFDINKIINICSEASDRIHIYYAPNMCFSFFLAPAHINDTICTLSNLIIEKKQNQSLKGL